MSNLKTFINAAKEAGVTDFRDLFNNRIITGLNTNFHLKYSLDKNRPDLFLIHPTDISNQRNELVRECNGIILDKNTFDVVSYGTKGLQKLDSKDELLKPENIVSITETEDGTMLKVFYYNEEWVVSTNRRIDAKRVKWSSSKTFYELLLDHFKCTSEELETLFSESLDKSRTYSFILLSSENQHVIYYEKSRLIFVESRHNLTFEQFSEIPSFSDEQKDVPRGDFLEKLNSLTRQSCRGAIVNGIYKVDYPWFEMADKLRKNLPTLKLSYIACNTDERRLFRIFFGNELYYNYLDNLINQIALFIYNAYRESYVRKLYRIPTDHPVSFVTNKLHFIYRTTKIPIDFHQVISVLDNVPCYITDSIMNFVLNYGFVCGEH